MTLFSRWITAGAWGDEELLARERVDLYLRWILWLATSFYLALLAAAVVLLSAGLLEVSTRPGRMVQAGGVILVAGARVYARGTHRLAWVEAIATVAFCSSCASAAMFAPVESRPELLAALATVLTLGFRAAVVPSSAKRTLWVGVCSSVPSVVLSFALRDEPAAPGGGTMPQVMSVAWAVAGVAVSVLTSRVIYGLREAVREVRRLGQYELGQKIGEGGMGAVYRGTHVMLKRATAVKLLRPDRVTDDTVRRFEREVAHTSKLVHPNTVAIFDYGRTPDGTFYYAMEYLDGLTLRELVEQEGPLPLGRVKHVMTQLAGSLAEAHGCGVVHRDIKPDNVMICNRGGVADHVKVLDFGIAKNIGRFDQPDLTSEVAAIGTPHYMAPEAILRPSTIDYRVDVYAAGVLGYFLVTGKLPFEGASAMEICSQHLHTLVPRISPLRDVPRELEALIGACMAKDPARRPTGAAELAGAFKALPDDPQWSEVQAVAWWAGWSRGRDSDRPDGGDLSGTTMAIDVTRRPPSPTPGSRSPPRSSS